MAVTADQPEIVQDLLFLGADINACDVKGQTALHLAATYGYPRILQVRLLVWPQYRWSTSECSERSLLIWNRSLTRRLQSLKALDLCYRLSSPPDLE